MSRKLHINNGETAEHLSSEKWEQKASVPQSRILIKYNLFTLSYFIISADPIVKDTVTIKSHIIIESIFKKMNQI
jgi:hypothetical protein